MWGLLLLSEGALVCSHKKKNELVHKEAFTKSCGRTRGPADQFLLIIELGAGWRN